MNNVRLTMADIEGPWTEPDWDSGLINRCRTAWNKPLDTLTNEEIATFLRQGLGVSFLLPIAESRLAEEYDDETEIRDGELRDAVARRRKT